MPSINHYRGLDSVPELFRFAFDRAVRGLRAPELRALHEARPGGAPPLWLPAAAQGDLVRLFETLAARRRQDRYRLRRPERDEVLVLLGGEASLDDGRIMFMLAWAIDVAFACYVEDYPRGVPEDIIPVAPDFLADVLNPPPPLGQMTPMAICRRWFRHLHLRAKTERLGGFGPFPTPVRRLLPPDTLEILESEMREGGELRAGLVAWRRHELPAGLRLSPSAGAGSFAILGYTRPAREGLLDDVLRVLQREKVHLAVLPEISLEQDELEELLEKLRSRHRKFPTLLVVGLAHVPRVGAHTNQAVLVTGFGREVLRSTKIEPYFANDTLGYEDIVGDSPEPYPFVDTPFGRLVLNICRDVRSDVPMIINRAIGATLVVVPSYSRRLDFVLEEARVLGQRQGAIMVAVGPPVAKSRDAFAFYAPLRGCLGSVLPADDRSDVLIRVVRFRGGSGLRAELEPSVPIAV